MGISHSMPNESYSARRNSTFTNSTTCIDVSLPNESYSGRTNITFAISPTCNDARSYVGTYFENSIYKKSIRLQKLERRERDDDYLFGLLEMMDLRKKASKCSKSENSTYKKSIRLQKLERRERDDDYLFGLLEMMDLRKKASKGSKSDPFADIRVDLPRLYLKRGSHTDLPIDTFRGNILSRLNKPYSDRMNSTFTISPTCTDVMSFVGTHVCEIGQPVRLGIQLYPRSYESSYDQDRLMNISSCSTIRLTSMDDWVEEIKRNVRHILEQGMRKLDDNLCGLANRTRIECRSYTPEMSRRMYLNWTVSNCSESHSENSTFKEPIQCLEHDTRECVDDVSFGLGKGTRNECVRSIPEKCSRMNKHLTATKCLESNSEYSTAEESIHIQKQETRKCVDDHLIGLENETRNKCAWSIPEKCSRMDLHSTPTKCSESNSENSTFKESINILEHDTRECIDDVSFGLGKGTRNECVRSIPQKCSRMNEHLTATKCLESNSDLIADVSKKRRIQYKKRIQSSLEFRRYVKRGSHIVLHREKFSYDHHMLILYVNGNLTQGLEYGFPEGLINIIDTLSEASLGRIQYKTIIIEELFQPNASKVYLVYSQRYPKTAEQSNTAIERVTSRIGEKMYSISHNNCENLVIWVLEGNSTSSQWRDAGVLRRAAGDVVEKILPVVVGNGANYLLQNLDPNVPNVPPNEDSIDLSPPEDETQNWSINDPAAPNQTCSKLSTMLRAFKSCITAGNTKLAILFLLLKLLIFFILDLSPGGYSLVIIMAFIFRTLILFFGPRFLVLEIDKLLLIKFMSRADIFREMFKIIVVYFASMTRKSRILTILETCVLCLYQLNCYILAGILFDAFICPLFHFLLIL